MSKSTQSNQNAIACMTFTLLKIPEIDRKKGFFFN